MSETVEGKILGISYPPAVDNIKNVKWRTKDGEVIPVPELKDSHLRNIALFLMGMGYLTCTASEDRRIVWLHVLRIEWERRLAQRREHKQSIYKELQGIEIRTCLK